MSTSSRMLRRLLRAPTPFSPHLVVCPFGGASYGAFRSWKALLQVDASVSLATYPGRDHRIEEPVVQSIQQMASELVQELCAEPLGGPWLLIGHSMGAQIAFEACGMLEQRGRAPAGLVLSACQAPHVTPRRTLSPLDDDGFVEELIRAGGCPAELRTDVQFRDAFLPMLRGDFLASESYRRALDDSSARLGTPTLLLYGSSDDDARPDAVEAWKRWLGGRVELHAVPGGHFYITQDPCAFLGEVSRMFRFPAMSLGPSHSSSIDFP